MARADGEPDADIIMFQLTADKAVVPDSLVSPLVPVKRHLWSMVSLLVLVRTASAGAPSPGDLHWRGCIGE
jgi:hypothetical protein